MYRIGHGYDSHRFVPGGPLRLGGIDIEENYRLAGHSDGDAVIHALCDAILGAMGEGDIGHYFPDTDPACRNADSTRFLHTIVDLLRRRHCVVENVDITVVAERPRLAPHMPGIRRVLSAPLDLHETQIGIKASTNEGMGFIGQGEGLAVWVVVLVREHVPAPSPTERTEDDYPV